MKWLFFLFFNILVLPANAQIKPANGLWTTDDDPAIGSGMMITTQNGVSVISLFTYDEAGKNIWYIASGRVNDEGVFESELIQSENGQNLLLNDPQSATFVEQRQSIKIEFLGSQLATMEVGGAEPKFISPNHFGFATVFGYPDLIGKWVMANKNTGESFILDLVGVDSIALLPIPVPLNIAYKSTHASTLGWELDCTLINGNPIVNGTCKLDSVDKPELPSLTVELSYIGSQKINLTSFDGSSNFQAFRLSQDSMLLPNDGLWRPADDPAVGSGMAMRTQGDFTVVLLYSYDEEGRAVWQNAAGQFDENGKMVADLYTPNNGTAIGSTPPGSAEFEGEAQILEIQLEGTELATFSINGSMPKYIQNSNFNTHLLNTENLRLNEKDFLFPEQSGNWVFTKESENNHKSGTIRIQDISGFISPIPPGAPPAYHGSTNSDLYPDGLSIYFLCPATDVSDNGVVNCYGSWTEGENSSDLKVHYQDIGLNNFRLQLKPEIEESSYSQIIKFFRLDD